MSMSNVVGSTVVATAAVEKTPRVAARPEPAVAPTLPVEAPAVSSANLERASAQIESYVRSSGRDLQFRVDDESGRVVVSVRDSETGELIRQIPNEEVLRIAQAIEQRDTRQPPVLIDDEA
jgi:flagellar protein FlaG